MKDALRSRWRTLVAASDARGAESLGEDLISAYAEPHRRYHGLSHVDWLLQEEERRASVIDDRALVQFAIWFHDAIYQPFAPDNEERSAAWARAALADLRLPASGDAVAQLVGMTKDHSAGAAPSPDGALFLDMDIAILGADPAAYARYAAGVRAEYAAAPDSAYIAGRSKFLESWLPRERLFRTDTYEAELAMSAKANMSWELSELHAGRIPTD